MTNMPPKATCSARIPKSQPGNVTRDLPCIISLSHIFRKGDLLVWNMYSQTAARVSVSLWDTIGKKVNYHVNQASPEASGLEAIDKGSSRLEGTGNWTDEDLCLQVINNSSDSGDIKCIEHANIISYTPGKRVGASYTLVLEDWTDNDYNDLFINIVSWKHYG